MLERRHLEAERCDDRLSAGVCDRPRRVGSHPSPRPLRVVLARKETRHCCGIDRRYLGGHREYLSIVETRGEPQSVPNRVIREVLSLRGVTSHQEMRITIRREFLG